MREARPITTQNQSVGLYRFATAFPGHREHVALQRQPFASAWPCRYTPFRRLTSGHIPFRGFQNVREARPITTQNPSVGLYRFATAFPGHRKHVALQRQSFASAFPVAILHLEGFKTCAKHGPSGHKTPLWAFTALPLPSPVTANTLPCSGSPLPAPGHVAILHLEGFKTCAEHGPSRHKTRLWAFTALPLPFPGHRKHVALQRQSFASAWPGRHTPFRGFQNVRDARPITTQNPSVGLYRFATAFPGHREHVALQRQPFASAWPCRHTAFNLEGFKTCAKHGPSRHKTPLWAFTPLPHCLPRAPQTRCPAAAALCQRLAMSPYSIPESHFDLKTPPPVDRGF